jgi:hypothetical protein
MARHGRGILLGCLAAHGVVTAAIEEEIKGAIEVRQLEHVGDQKMRLYSGGLSASFRLLYGQRCYVDARDVKALLAGQRQFVPVPQPMSRARQGRIACRLTTSCNSEDGCPVSHGRSPSR